MPDTYRKLAEDAVEMVTKMEQARYDTEQDDPWPYPDADRELRERLRALDEAGPYGWAVEVDGAHYIRSDYVFRERATAVHYARFFTQRGESAELIPVHAGTPEEVEGE